MLARQLMPEAGEMPATGALRLAVRTFLAEWFAEHDVRPAIDGWVSGWSPELSFALAVRGWVGMAIPTEYGGAGRSPFERHVVAEELLAAGAPVAYHWFADRQIAPALLRFGTAGQRGRYLPAIAAGRHSFALGLSEPDAGSDLAAVRTRADRVADGWRLRGVKLWTSNAHRADSMTVLARTADSAETPRAQSLSQFLVDLPDPAVTVRPIRQLGGGHHFNEVHLDDVFVPDEQVLGVVGEGWRQVTSELGWERSGPERFLSTFPLYQAASPDDADAAELGGVLARITALHDMSLRVAGALTRGEDANVAAALVKDLGTTLEGDVVEVLGRGTPPEPGSELDRLLIEATLSAPGFTLRGGSTEVLRSIVARELVGR
jgi:alkylation response protein AidB-like acyl-CoA dehydrogenase